MAESVRKRTSKWDLVAETHFPTETVEENAPSGNAGSICNEKESNPGLVSSETHIAELPGTEANDVMRAKDSSGGSCWEPVPRSEDERKDGNIDRNRKEISLAEDKWGGDQSYSAHMSPGLDSWRQRRSSPSPRRRSKSRRSRSRSRSRSRTPPYGFKRGREDWSSRVRSGTGRTTVACRDFAKGRCRRGSQCRYLHQDSHDYEDRRHYDRGPAENRWSRQDRGGSPGYAGDGAYIDSQEQNSCPQDKLSHYVGSHHDVDREKHDSRKNRRFSVLCNDFLKGKCYRGSTCKYIHHGDSADGYGGWPSKEGSREGAAHDRGGTGSSFGHDHRREGGRSNTLCKYFAEGRCHKGEYCRFSHQDPVHGGPEGRSRDDRWSHSRGSEDRSWDGPRWGVEASNGNLRNSPSLCGPENRPWDGSNKVSDGNVCNPPHLEGPENSSWNGPKWSRKTSGKNLANSDTGAISFPENKPWEAPISGGGNRTDKTISDPSQWKSDKNSARGDEPGFPEPRNAENVFSSKGVCPTGENRGGLPPDMATQEPIRNPQNLHSSNSEEEIKHQFLPKEVPDINLPATYEQNTTEVLGGEPQRASTVLLQQTLPENTYIQQHPGLRVDAAALSPFEGKNKVSNSANPANEISFSNKMPVVVSMPEQCFSEIKQSQQLVPASLPSVAQGSIPSGQSQWGVLSPPNSQDFNPNVQTQQIVRPPSNEQNYYLSGHSQQTVIPPLGAQNFNPNENNSQQMVPQPPSGVQPQANGNNGQQMIPHPPSGAQLQAFPGHEESVRRPELQDVSMSSMPCETPTAQNIVTSEQLSKITDLSASLQQIFGNGPQLPQLYASLNHLSAAGLVPSLPHSLPNTVQPPSPMTVPSIQPNQQAWPQNQYDPVHDKMESLNPDINDQPPGFSTNLFEQKSATIEESQAPSKSSAPSSAPSEPNDVDDQNSGDPVGKMDEENQVFNQLDVSKEVNEEMNGQYNKEQETGHLKDMDAGDGQCDEDSKRSKETKGMRMFRIALVEFVKELLKPTWKEGHMSKEAYKTIVKKVTDKVTGALQGPNIPQTQEKIDHYLSYSKPKLTKLVQAYVEKYMKS